MHPDNFCLRKKPPLPAASIDSDGRYYCGFSCSEMKANLVFKVEPIAVTVPMITTEMPAAMRPYSIAVAPDSSFRKEKILDICVLHVTAYTVKVAASS